MRGGKKYNRVLKYKICIIIGTHYDDANNVHWRITHTRAQIRTLSVKNTSIQCAVILLHTRQIAQFQKDIVFQGCDLEV